MDKHITVPMKKETVATLKAGDYVYLQERSIQQEMQRIKECMRFYRKAGNFQLIFKVR